MMERVLGEKVAISVATAQIFEITLNEELVKKPDGLIFNVRTLWRNYWEAWSDSDRPNVREITDGFFDELDVIGGLVRNLGISAIYVWPEYRALESKLPGSVLKKSETDKAIAYDAAEKYIEVLVKQNKYANIIDTLIPKANGNAWLVSHLPIDLLSRYQFTSLKLLESHTGALVEPVAWNKKLFSNKNYRRMPFNSFTLSIYGDRSKMFKGHPIGIRKAVYNLAVENRWTPMTTLEKIRFDINKVTDQNLKSILVKALSCTLK